MCYSCIKRRYLHSQQKIIYMKKIIVFIVLSLIISGCRNKKEKESLENSPMVISVKESDLGKKYDFYDIIEDIEFVTLETIPESLISVIDKIEFFNSKFYILDGRSRSILIFDNKGKYIDKVARVGPGPYEYNDIIDFCVHPGTGEISIATDTRKILTISSDLKKCTLFENTPFAVGIKRCKNGDYVLTSTEREANVYVADSNMNFLNKGLPNPIKYSAMIGKTLSSFEDTILCHLPTSYNDTIYRITTDSFKPWCIIDFEVHPDFSNPSKYIQNDPIVGKMYVNPGMHIPLVTPFLETRKIVYFPMSYEKRYNRTPKTVLYSKGKSQVRVIDNKLQNLPFYPYFYFAETKGISSDRFVFQSSAHRILEIKIYKEDDPISLRLKELKKQLNEDSNPVLELVKFKE